MESNFQNLIQINCIKFYKLNDKRIVKYKCYKLVICQIIIFPLMINLIYENKAKLK